VARAGRWRGGRQVYSGYITVSSVNKEGGPHHSVQMEGNRGHVSSAAPKRKSLPHFPDSDKNKKPCGVYGGRGGVDQRQRILMLTRKMSNS